MYPVKWDSNALFQHLGGDHDGGNFYDLHLCEETEEAIHFQIPKPPWTHVAFTAVLQEMPAVRVGVLITHLGMG